MKRNIGFNFWAIISLLVIGNLILFDLTIILSAEELQVQFVPDDTYYYLQLAKNFSRLGYWTFDSGISRTSGFHPLLAYYLATIYRIFQPNTETFVSYAISVSVFFTSVTGGFLWWNGFVNKQKYFLMFISLMIGAQSVFFNSVSGIEWSLVIALTSAYCLIFYSSTVENTKKTMWIFMFGLLLSLARSDAGLLPFLILIIAYTLDKSKVFVRTALWGFMGVSTGLFFALYNSYFFTGKWIQTSARVKAFWVQYQEISPEKGLQLILRAFGLDVFVENSSILFYVVPTIFIVIWTGLAAFFFISARNQRGTNKSHLEIQMVILFVASLFSLGGYILFYTRNGDVQLWYTANITVALFILSLGTISYLGTVVGKMENLLNLFLTISILFTVISNYYSVYPLGLYAPWKHQQATLRAGKYLEIYPVDGKIGSWNAGVIGYYQGGNVINLDGLVNDDVYPYIVKNELSLYLRENDIAYIVDFQTMFSDDYSQRGGYDGVKLLEDLEPIYQFDDGEFWYWEFLTLYKAKEKQ